VEIAADVTPVCGRIGRAGGGELSPFTGWTELAVAIERYTRVRSGRGDDRSNEPPQSTARDTGEGNAT
jgi:hypothetical protein